MSVRLHYQRFHFGTLACKAGLGHVNADTVGDDTHTFDSLTEVTAALMKWNAGSPFFMYVPTKIEFLDGHPPRDFFDAMQRV